MRTADPSNATLLINDTSLMGLRRRAVAKVAYEKYNGTMGLSFERANPQIQQVWLEHTRAILAALKDPELTR